MPGDPATLFAGPGGTSLAIQRPVASVVGSRIGATLALMGTSLALTVVVAVPAGFVAAVRPFALASQGVMAGTILLLSVPNFLVGLLLMDLLVVRLGWLPAAGSGGGAFLVMPTLAIAARLVALVSRTTRASLPEILGEDCVRAVRAKGLEGGRRPPPARAPARADPDRHHAGAPGRLSPWGSVVIETLFAYQGLGQAMITAVFMRDVILGLNLLGEALRDLLDPKLLWRP